MANRIWIPSPSTYMKDVGGSVLGALIDTTRGETVCWHVEIIDDVRTITGYTIVQRNPDAKLQPIAHRSR